MPIHDLIATVATAGVPVAFAVFIWLSRDFSSIHWARTAGIVGAVAGVASAGLSFLARPKVLHATRDTYLSLLAFKYTLDGIFVGIFVCVLLSKPWTKSP